MVQKKWALISLFLFLLFFMEGCYAKRYLNESNSWGQGLAKVEWSSIVLGDLDNDGRLDMALAGCNRTAATSCSGYVIKIYINNGTSLVENSTWEQNLTVVNRASLAFGDVDNDGKLDLALVGCNNGGGNSACNNHIAKIYINNGTSLVENFTWQQNLTGVFYGSLALGDIDGDGKLDLALSGSGSNGLVAKIYMNNGTTLVENQSWQQNLKKLYMSAIALGDINNDGYLDMILSGQDGGYQENTKVYLNNGTSFTENQIWQQGLLNVDDSSLILGDFNNDGYLDLSLIGHTTQDNHRIYKNNGSIFILIQKELTDLIGIYDGSLAFGDYDIDGYLDIIASGHEGYTTLYLYNVSNSNFTTYNQDPESEVMGLSYGPSVVWADLDNDTDLDLIETGWGGGDFQAKTYISNRSLTLNNTQPQPSNSSFSAIYENNRLNLGWGNGSDNETLTAGLYYNLRVGTASGGNQVVSGVYGGSSNPTAGYFGNMMQRKNISLGGYWLENNTTYYWSVQTIDTGLAKSSWSVEQTFITAGDITYPQIVLNDPQDSNYSSFSNITFNATASDNTAISNVSLYGSWGGWHRNQTNSSGLNGTEYLFQVNLSGYPEGTYTWAIHACDSTGNCLFSANRTVIKDLTSPLIALESPANASAWIENNSVSFNFNVTDLAIANCSLIIGSSLKHNFSSVAVNTSTNATIDLENGIYNWSVNCTDMLLRQNSSGPRQITVDYQAPAPLSSGGGSSSGGASYLTYSMGELKEAQEINKELRKGDKINFNLDSEGHNLTISRITNDNATIEINSTIARFTLGIGESRMLNLSSNGYYDFYVRLNSIANLKADITIRRILEVIAPKIEENPKENTSISKNISSQEEPENQAEEKNFSILPALSYAAGAVIIAGLFLLYMKLRKKNLS
jgi:hypothetical protein